MDFEVPDLNVTKVSSVDVASVSGGDNELPFSPFGTNLDELDIGFFS